MGHAAGQLADGFELLRLAQRRFGLFQTRGALLDPFFQRRVQFGQGRQAFAHGSVGTGALDVGPGSLGDLHQQRQVVG
ncbi:hypothetical protein D3C78_1842340 [compost metagenome]